MLRLYRLYGIFKADFDKEAVSMRKVIALVLSLSLVAALIMPCAFASNMLPTICSLHDFSTRFSLATFFYKSGHEFLSEYMESSVGDVKSCISTFFPSANSYVEIFMPAGTTDIYEIVINNYGNNTSSQSVDLFILIYEIVMAAGGFSTTQDVNDCMDKLGMIENFGIGNSGSLNYHGLHLYWLMSEYLGFVFCISAER